MGKPKTPRRLAENEARAVARNLRVSPQKLNLVAGLIRGKKVNQALADLEFSLFGGLRTHSAGRASFRPRRSVHTPD